MKPAGDLRLSVAVVVLLAGCVDEGISGYVDPDTVWQLEELNGVPFTARATLSFPEAGKTTGNGPCNAFFARQTVPLPWIKIEGLASTRKACPQLTEERRYFSALEIVSLAEVAGDILLLSDGDTKTEMVFRATLPEPN